MDGPLNKVGFFLSIGITQKKRVKMGVVFFLIFISDYTGPTGTKLTWNVHWIILYKVYLFFVNWNYTKETICVLVFCMMHKI